jgi:hypothetical protein
MPVSQTVYLQARGLQTANSQVDQGDAPGFLSVAQNLVLNHQGLWEPRRGIGLAVDASEYMAEEITSLVTFNKHVVAVSADGAVTAFNASSLAVALPLGTVLATIGVGTGVGNPAVGFVRGMEAKGNLYLASSAGIQAMDVGMAALRPAGLVMPSIYGYSLSAGGVFPTSNYATYRVALSFTDASGNLVIGPVSNPMVVSNFTGGDVIVQLLGQFAGTPPAGYKVLVYRTLFSTVDEPGDEEFLVGEAAVVAEYSGYSRFFINDSVGRMSAALYSNASQEGISQSNSPPPASMDLASYRGISFYSAPYYNPAVLCALARNPLAGDVYHFPGGDVTVVDTATSIPLRQVNRNNVSVYFFVGDLVRVINGNTSVLGVHADVISGRNFVAAGDSFLVTSNSPTSALTVSTSPSTGVFVFPSGDTSPVRHFLNRLAFSKPLQPEAVPVLNFVDIGAQDKAILRILPLRDALFVLKEDGVWRLTGTSVADFDVQPYNLDLFLVSPNSLVGLHNSAIGLFNHGVIRFTDSEVENIALDVDDIFKAAIEPAILTKTASLGWGLSYPAERQYWLSLPALPGDTTPSLCYVWGERLKQWTGPFTKVFRAGVVHPGTNKAFLGLGFGLYLERKTGSIQDFSDSVIWPATDVVSYQNLDSGNVLVLADMTGISPGDVVSQASGAIYSTVLFVDPGLRYLLVDTAQNWSLTAGATSVHEGIPTVCKWSPAYGGSPGASHRWRETSLAFKTTALALASLSFASDLDPLEEHVNIVASEHGIHPNRQQTRNLRVLVPRSKQRANNLTVSFNHRSGWAPFQLQGMTLILQNVSERTGR